MYDFDITSYLIHTVPRFLKAWNTSGYIICYKHCYVNLQIQSKYVELFYNFMFFRGPSGLLFDWYQGISAPGVKRPRCESENSLPFYVEITDECSCIYAPTTCLNSVCREICTVNLLSLPWLYVGYIRKLHGKSSSPLPWNKLSNSWQNCVI